MADSSMFEIEILIVPGDVFALVVSQYDKDIKKKVKIQIACDKIVELRLRQASIGDLGVMFNSCVCTDISSVSCSFPNFINRVPTCETFRACTLHRKRAKL